jgi:hypothetical protein
VTIEARLADGTVLQFPDGTADDVVDRTVQQHMQQAGGVARGREANAAANPGEGLQRSIIQGLTFGLGDEFNAGVRATVQGLPGMRGAENWSDRYNEALAVERGRNQAYAQDNPISATAGNLLGGVMGPGLAMRGAQAGAGTVQRLVRSAPVRGAVAGGTGGAATGFGEGEGGFAQRVDNAAQEGLVGAGAGAALGAGVNLASRVGGRVLDVAGLRNPEIAADRQVLRALERDGVPPADLPGRVAAMPEHGILADVGGRNTVNLGAVAANTPGRAMEVADTVTQARRGGAPDRMAEAAEAGFGGGAGSDFRVATDALRAERAVNAAPHYERAFRIQLTPDEYGRIANFVEDPIGQEAFRRGIRIAELEGLRPGSAGFDPAAYGVTRGPDGQWIAAPGQTPNMRLMDAVKRGFDDIVEGFRDPTTGRLNLDQYGRAVNGARAAYRDELAGMFPPYRRALEAYSGPSQSLDAAGRGRRAFTSDRDVTAAGSDTLSPGDRDFFRLGAGRAFTDMTSDPARVPGVARRLLEDRQMQQRLGTIIPDAARREALVAALRGETQTAAVDRAVSPRAGSQTARLQAAGDDMGVDPPGGFLMSMLDAGARGGATGAASRGMAALYRRGQGINPSTADALAQRLFSMDRAQNAATATRLTERQVADAVRANAQQQMMARLLRGLGTAQAIEN